MAADALSASEAPGPNRLPLLVSRAVRFYLDERGHDGADWLYPAFLGEGSDGAVAGHDVPIDEELWRELQAEAERQEVAAEDLLRHAAFYYAAARDEGRLTERIAAELAREEGARG
jgi:hypothetical protein